MIENIVVGIVTGIITGFITSWIVSYIFQLKADKKEFDRKQYELLQFLQKIQDELLLANDPSDCVKLIWVLSNKPMYDISHMSIEDIKLMERIDCLCKDIRRFSFDTHGLYFKDEAKDQLKVFENKAQDYSGNVKKIKFTKRRK